MQVMVLDDEINISGGAIDKDTSVELMYMPFFCKYLREVIRLAVGYDMYIMTGHDSVIKCGEDIRFLTDVKRVNVVKHMGIVFSAIDFYCSLLVFRGERSDKVVQAIRKKMYKMVDYHHVLFKCMELIQEVAGPTLEAEKAL